MSDYEEEAEHGGTPASLIYLRALAVTLIIAYSVYATIIWW